MSDPATLTSAASPSMEEGPVTEPFGHPSDTFDVEPPYVPDAAELEAVEKYDDRFIDREVSWLALQPSASSSWPRTPPCRCWSERGSSRSSPATSTSSSWSGWPVSSAGSRPASPYALPAG